ncbi:MAG: metallophosphoesterase [Phycisphaerales bacterium]|nr:metallophosphoesterase [Phycisphaerales bacterium]
MAAKRGHETGKPTKPKRSVKFRKAKIRHVIFTLGADRLTGGWLGRRHDAQAPVTRHVEISTPAWPRDLDGIRIGHVSDFHFGDLMSLDKALLAVEALRAESPEIICNTGDLVDLEWSGVEPLAQAFADLNPPLGNYFVLGNHDELDSADEVARIASEAGLHVLRDDTFTVRRNDADLTIGGIDWARTPPQCQSRIDTMVERGGRPDILLCHNPKGFDHAAELGIPLTLSGHTHGGQIARRNKPDANMAFAHRRSAGLYENGHYRLFVTVGVGAWFPLRFNCPAEVVIITMRHGQPDATHD